MCVRHCNVSCLVAVKDFVFACGMLLNWFDGGGEIISNEFSSNEYEDADEEENVEQNSETLKVHFLGFLKRRLLFSRFADRR